MNIEEILVNAAHSDDKSISYLEQNIFSQKIFEEILCVVESSDIGDARMEGAFWISKSDNRIIAKNEKRLLNLINEELDSIVVHIMVALSKIKSQEALKMIIERRVKPVLYWESIALENYFKGETDEI